MANSLQYSSQIVTNEILRIAHNTSAFLGNVNTDFESMWTGQFAPGQTVYARGPVSFTSRSGETASVQDITEWTTPITLQPLLGIDFALNLTDMVTAVGNNGNINERFKERYIKPAGLKISALLDSALATIMKNGFHQFVGTPGTPPSTIADVLNAQVPMDRMSVPRDGMRMAALEPAANASVVAGLATLFNNQSMLGEQYKTGVLKTGLGMDFIMSQNVPSHTVGAYAGTPLVNGGNQGLINAGATDNPRALTSTLVTDGWTATTSRIAAGDIITLGLGGTRVESVNPETKASTGVLQDFVVTAAVTADGGGNKTLTISPAIIAGGAYQNVTVRPADNAVITVRSGTASTTYTNNLLWHKDAVTLVSPEQNLPQGMAVASKASLADEGGISLRWVQGYDITNNRNINRIDVLWGAAVVLPNFGVRRTN